MVVPTSSAVVVSTSSAVVVPTSSAVVVPTSSVVVLEVPIVEQKKFQVNKITYMTVALFRL